MHYILIISPEPWQWQYVSKHHYAINLANLGHQVYFLNPPDNTINHLNILDTNIKNLYEIQASQLAKGLRFYPKFIRRKIEMNWLNKFEKIINNKFSIIWNFENSRFYNMEFFGTRLKIYHQVDSNQNFHVEEAAISADVCFCVTDFIKRDLLAFNNNVYKIPHGINLTNHNSTLSKAQKLYFNKESIHVAYIGNLDMIYINENIIYDIVNQFPNAIFHFIGSYSNKSALHQRCKDAGNVIFWGRVDSALIPTILKKAQINLLAYRVEEYTEQLANSHKILEYLHSGNVTVATYTDEYKDKRHLLEMVDNSSDYVKKFKYVISHIDECNSQKRQQQRILYAMNNGYEAQLDKISLILKENNLKSL